MTEREALELALEALERCGSENYTIEREAINAIREVLAQQCVCGEQNSAGTHRTDGFCLAPQPEQQEPVAWRVSPRYEDLDGYFDFTDSKETADTLRQRGWEITPLYTIPPQRAWIGLTNDDWDEIFGNALTIGEAIKVTEAKLKAKNFA